MTIWILHQPLTPQEEAHIQERTHLTLPFDGLPDLSLVSRIDQLKHLLRTLYPDDPPETVIRRLDRFWHRLAGLQPEDTVVVPLKERQEIALAAVTNRYQYQAGEDGTGKHLVAVKWHTVVPLRKLAKHKAIFAERGESMYEVLTQDARVALRDQLPHSYNRFVRWKWLIIFFFLLNIIRMFYRTPN